MPSFTIQIPNLIKDGPVVDVLIGPSRLLVEELKKRDQKIPKPIPIKMLFDTGASGSAVKDDLPQKLNLKPQGIVPITTPSSENFPCPIYHLAILFPNQVVTEVQAIAAPLKCQSIQGLIGRDILRSVLNQFKLKIKRTNRLLFDETW